MNPPVGVASISVAKLIILLTEPAFVIFSGGTSSGTIADEAGLKKAEESPDTIATINTIQTSRKFMYMTTVAARATTPFTRSAHTNILGNAEAAIMVPINVPEPVLSRPGNRVQH